MWAILLAGQGLCRASRRCSSFDLSLGSFVMVDLCLWDAFSRWRCSWRVHSHPMWKSILLDWALQLMYDVCVWSILDRYIIKWHGGHAWYGCWTIKALVEAEVYDGFTVSFRGIAAPLIIARPLGVSILLIVIRQAWNLFNKGKILCWHCVKSSLTMLSLLRRSKN